MPADTAPRQPPERAGSDGPNGLAAPSAERDADQPPWLAGFLARAPKLTADQLDHLRRLLGPPPPRTGQPAA